jgi:membrane protease subunit HflC
MKQRMMFVVCLCILFSALSSSVLFVDAAEYVYVTQFGRLVQTYDGARDAGLQIKWPWPIQSAMRFDRRLHIFDVPTQEFLIRDRDTSGQDKPLPLIFDVFVCWRIGSQNQQNDAEAVDRFVRSFGNVLRAEHYLRTQIVSRLKAELATIFLHDLINTDEEKLQINQLMNRVRSQPGISGESSESLEQQANKVGIELIDVKLRRFNHPFSVREDIYSKIREERRREAEMYRNQGSEQAARLRAEGELEARRIRSEADAAKVRLEGQAEAESVRLLNQAAMAHPELYGIFRLLKGTQKMFADDKTQLILSLDHPLLALFKNLPQLSNQPDSPGNKK